MSVRTSFVEHFGEDQAKALEHAAQEHGNGVNNQNLGEDPFKWAILIVIGYECAGRFAEHHGITVKLTDLQNWCIAHGELRTHTGDCDYLALMTGSYDAFLPPAPAPASA